MTLAAGRLSSATISHFLLDLQEADQRTAAGGMGDTNGGDRSQSSGGGGHSIAFADRIGSLGASIGPAHYGSEADAGASAEDAPADVRSSEPEAADLGTHLRREGRYSVQDRQTEGGRVPPEIPHVGGDREASRSFGVRGGGGQLWLGGGSGEPPLELLANARVIAADG